jgi:hypothetical protein
MKIKSCETKTVTEIYSYMILSYVTILMGTQLLHMWELPVTHKLV